MNKKGILASMASIALCATLAVGGTYALFTSQSKTNIAITSGEVEVEATIENLAAYSPTLISADGTLLDDTNAATGLNFVNGGSVSLEGATLTLDRMTAGDKATFDICIVNNSDVAIQWQTAFEVSNDTGLFAGLSVSIDGEALDGGERKTEWTAVDAGAPIAPDTITVVVELPVTAGKTYMGTSCDIQFAIHAIQSNATAEVFTDFNDLQGEEAQNLSGKLNVLMPSATLTAETPDLSIGDANFKQSTVNEIVFDGGVIDSPYKDGSRNPNFGNSHVYNEYNGSRILLNVPQNSKVVFNDLTINGYYNFTAYGLSSGLSLEFVNCTFNGCWIGEINGLANITFKGCKFTLEGLDAVNVKDTNPIWWGTTAGQTLTLESCSIEGNRPIKFGEGASGAILNVRGCTFTLTASEYDNNANRLDRLTALRFDDKVSVGEISGNTMVSGYAFYQTNNAPYSDADYVDTDNVKPENALWRVEY